MTPELWAVLICGLAFLIVIFAGLSYSEYLDYKLKIKMAELGYVEMSKPTWVKMEESK